MKSDWEDTCRNTKVDGALPISFSVLPATDRGWCIRVEMTAPTLDGNEYHVISMNALIDDLDADEASRVAVLRDLALAFYRHELDEQFKCKGVVMFRPWHEHDGEVAHAMGR